MIVTVFHRLVILLFNVIVDINIGVLAYLTQFIGTLKCENDVCTYANAKIIYEKCFQLKKSQSLKITRYLLQEERISFPSILRAPLGLSLPRSEFGIREF
jgi:hypothetical protein